MYKSSISSMGMDSCYINVILELLLAPTVLLRIMPLRRLNLGLIALVSSVALNSDAYASTSKQLPGRGKKI